MNRMHAKGLNNRKKQRRKDQDCRSYIHKGTCDQQDHIHNQQDNNRAVGKAQKSCGNRLRNLGKCHNPSENIRYADEEYDHTAHLCAVHQNLPEALPCYIAVADAQHQRIDNGDGRAFRRGEYACDNASDNHDNQGKRRDGF